MSAVGPSASSIISTLTSSMAQLVANPNYDDTSDADFYSMELSMRTLHVVYDRLIFTMAIALEELFAQCYGNPLTSSTCQSFSFFLMHQKVFQIHLQKEAGQQSSYLQP